MIPEARSLVEVPAIRESRSGARLARALLARVLPSLRCGHLHIVLPSGETMDLRGGEPGPEASVALARWRPFWRLLSEGDLGLARSYIDGDWSTPDLRALIDFGLRNESDLATTADGWRMSHALNRLRHRLRANTPRGSRRNIAAHYDLGNDFYAAWLDTGMNYSSGLYRTSHETLEQAQDAKLARAVALLDLAGGERVLEIGCGWGGMAERLVREHGCSVTGLTLSSEQLDFAQRRLASAKPGQADLRLQDYRDVEGRYDRIVSIEMLEAVGERYWSTYFEKLRDCLAERGTAVLQVITIEPARLAGYRRRPDFIQRFIFPGGMLPTVPIIRREADRAGLALVAHEPFGASYARTLQDWRDRFLRAWPQIAPLGFDLRFRRMWEYYLTFCEAGFRAGAIDVGFFKFVRR